MWIEKLELIEVEREALIPNIYQDLKAVFSKVESNKLPLHWIYNYKIELEGDYKLTYSLLYKYIEEELQAAKKYITENLTKGFITPSQAPFISPIIFTWKGDSGL